MLWFHAYREEQYTVFGLSRYPIIDIIEFNTFWTYTAVLKQTEG